jgi:hypothetical protein
MTYARWEDALDAQLSLYLFATSDMGMRYAAGWAQSAAGDEPRNLTRGGALWAVPSKVAALAFNADTFSVEPEMQTLWEAAVGGFEPEPLKDTDLLTERGFLWLPRPFATIDVHGKETSFRAIGWHRMEFTLHGGEDADEVTRKNGGVMLFLFHAVGDPDEYEGTAPDPGPPGTLLLDHMMPWEFGLTYKAPEHVRQDVLKPIQVLWRLLAQQIVTRTAQRPTRHVRRRLAKAKMPERDIVVVRLRRPKGDAPEGQEPRTVEWTHRWLVSGHWRQQWFPSLSLHRQIWISPFVKGPEDKPLEVRKARVFSWSR